MGEHGTCWASSRGGTQGLVVNAAGPEPGSMGSMGSKQGLGAAVLDTQSLGGAS